MRIERERIGVRQASPVKRDTERFSHIRRLTDGTGIMEHALGAVPRRLEGYSTDDQARALWMCLEWLELLDQRGQEALHPLMDTYLSFMLWVQKDNGHFHNNIAYDRTFETEEPSDDCLGRCLWACSVAYAVWRQDDRRTAVEEMLKRALSLIRNLSSTRGWAHALASVSLLMQHGYPQSLRSDAEWLAGRLMQAYSENSLQGWSWYEPMLTYSNGLLPWGLLCGYEVLQDRSMLSTALESLDFLIGLSVSEQGHIRPIGNRGWCAPGKRALWDQQPIDVFKLLLAASKAYRLTNRSSYADIAVKCWQWFHGDNDAGEPMICPATGGAYDGLTPNGVNLNQGAESTIAYLLSEAYFMKLRL